MLYELRLEIGLATQMGMHLGWKRAVLKSQKGLQGAVGIIMVLTLNASASVRYVDVNCTNATPPFTNWQTAAVTIQDAVDATTAGDQILVTNGIYAVGGRVVSPYLLTNRVVVTRRLRCRV